MRLLRWMLWSQARFLAVTAGGFAAVALLSLATSGAAPTPAPVGPSATSTPTVGEAAAAAAGAPAPADDERATAKAFLAAWMTPGDQTVGWVEGMRPYASPLLLSQMYGVDPTLVPTGRARHVKVVSTREGVALVRGTLPGGVTVFLSMTKTGTGWQVDSITGEER